MVSYFVTGLLALCLFAATYWLGEWLVRRMAPRFRYRARRMRQMDGGKGGPDQTNG